MHFALPPRKSSFPPPYARASAKSVSNQRQRKQIQLLGYIVLGVLSLFLVVRWLRAASGISSDGAVPEDHSVLIVTVLDHTAMSEDYIHIIKANRDDYAARHGYKTFYTNTSTYSKLTESSPSSWSLIPALRHALTLHPTTDYVWSLSANAMITNVTLSLHSHILSQLPSIMQKDIPVVPPDSVIHTFSHIAPNQAHIILTQDIDNLSHTSFLLRNTQTIPHASDQPADTWTQFLLDAWFDPLYRAYSFQKAENHALEHIVQWHPTILAKLVLVEQRRLNSYNYQPANITDSETKKERSHDSMWQPGDLIVNFKGCEEINDRDCETEMRDYFAMWSKEVERIDGKRPAVESMVKEYTAVSKTDKKPDINTARIHI